MVVLETLITLDIGGRPKELIKSYLNQHQPEEPGQQPTLDRVDIEMVVAFVRVEKCTDKERSKVVIAMQNFELRQTIIKSLQNEGKSVYHCGPAPAGWLEEELSLWLETLKDA